jgi:hypothetical protein
MDDPLQDVDLVSADLQSRLAVVLFLGVLDLAYAHVRGERASWLDDLANGLEAYHRTYPAYHDLETENLACPEYPAGPPAFLGTADHSCVELGVPVDLVTDAQVARVCYMMHFSQAAAVYHDELFVPLIQKSTRPFEDQEFRLYQYDVRFLRSKLKMHSPKAVWELLT